MTLCTHTRLTGLGSSRPRSSQAGLEQRAALIAAGVMVLHPRLDNSKELEV